MGKEARTVLPGPRNGPQIYFVRMDAILTKYFNTLFPFIQDAQASTSSRPVRALMWNSPVSVTTSQVGVRLPSPEAEAEKA